MIIHGHTSPMEIYKFDRVFKLFVIFEDYHVETYQSKGGFVFFISFWTIKVLTDFLPLHFLIFPNFFGWKIFRPENFYASITQSNSHLSTGNQVNGHKTFFWAVKIVIIEFQWNCIERIAYIISGTVTRDGKTIFFIYQV